LFPAIRFKIAARSPPPAQTSEETGRRNPLSETVETTAPAQEETHTHDHEGHDHESHNHEGELQEGLHTHHHRHGPALNAELTKEISVEVPADVVSETFKASIKRYQKMAKFPGFRAGKVPEGVIRNRFMKELRQEVLEQLVGERFQKEIAEQNLQPISQPQMMDLHLFDGEPLRFKAQFEVLPEFDVAGYDSVAVEKPDTTLTEEEFQTEINHMLDGQSTMEPVEEDRVLADGDYAEVSFTGKLVGEENSDDLKADHALVEVGGKDTVDAFNTALRGAKPGQQMQLEVAYPEEFGEKRLAGKSVNYDLEVKAIKRKVMPELTDEFVKTAGGYENVDAFKTSIREQMANRKKQSVENDAREKMVDEWVKKFEFPVPESLVQQQVDARLERGLRALAQQGMTSEAMRQLDFERLRSAQRDTAIAEVKASLILDKIAKAENTSVSDDELDRELMLVSLQTREPLDTLKQRLTQDGGINRIREQMLREKTGTAVYERLAK
jgi:trigger factor